MLNKSGLNAACTILIFAAASFQCVAKAPVKLMAKKIVREGSSWVIPGLRQINGQMPTMRRRISIEGIEVDEAQFSPVYNNMNTTHPGDVVAIIYPGNDQVVLREEELLAASVSVFSVAGRNFCVLVTVHPYTYDDRSKIGGVVASEFSLAFYDDGGDGQYKTLEPASVELGGSVWRPRIPEWVRGR